jgi:hypothetical protein
MDQQRNPSVCHVPLLPETDSKVIRPARHSVPWLPLLLWAGMSVTAGAYPQSLLAPSTIAHTGTAVEFFANEANLINGTGLSATPVIANYPTITHASAAAANAWVTTNPNGAGDFFLGATPPTVVFQMGFSQTFRLSDFVFWGYHFGAANGNEGRRFELEFSNDGGVTYGSPIPVERTLGNAAVSRAATLDLGQDINANFVRLKVTDNHFGSAAGGDRVGLGEIRFIGEPVRDPWIGASAITTSSPGGTLAINIPLSNLGLANTLTLSSATFSGQDASLFTLSGTLPQNIAPGANGGLIANFNPAGGIGSFSASLDIASNDPSHPLISIPINVAVAIPNAGYPAQVNFGPVANGAPVQNFTVPISNSGSGALNIVGASLAESSVNIDLVSDFALTQDFVEPIAVLPGASGLVQISFDPDGLKGGVYRVNLQVTTDDPDTPTAVIPVTVEVQIPTGSKLAGWWPLETDARDASGNEFNGEVFGTIDFTPGGATGSTGGSADFDGASRITVPFQESLNPSSYTVTLWANPDLPLTGINAAITSRFDAFAANSRNYGFILYRNTADWEYWNGTGLSTTSPWAVTETTPVTGEAWTHLAITYNHATKVKTLYVNGTAAATTPSMDFGRNLLRDLHLGGGGDLGTSFYFNGRLDDIAIFREALDATAINTILTAGVSGYTGLALPPGEPPPIAITAATLTDGNLVITGTANLIPGQSYHLQSSADLDFVSVPGSTFMAGNPIPPLAVSGPRFFVRIAEGSAPGL